MFQSGALFSSMTVGENVGFALQEWTELPGEAVSAIVNAKLALVGLEGAENKLPAELSGGMKKRAAIARAMAFEPSLIFLDEPSAGLDPISAAELDDLIIALNRGLGLTVVMVTHNLGEARFFGERAALMRDGHIVQLGPIADLASKPAEPFVTQFLAAEEAL